MFRPRQIVLRSEDGAVVEIAEVDAWHERVRLTDGTWVGIQEVEDPLRASYEWDLNRAESADRLRHAVERSDFAAAFPRIAEDRGARSSEVAVLLVLTLALAALESLVVLALAAMSQLSQLL